MANGVSRQRRPLILAFLVTAISLGSIEGTIVATAMPSIVASLGGFELYGWVFAVYLLTQAVATPIGGRIADLAGRKPVLLVSLAIFLVASLACGFAPSIEWLIAFRLVQGLGAGGIFTMVVTLAGDMYSLRERGRIQAYFASVWAVSSVVGPLVGGLLVAYASWAWVFWFNLPFGLVAMFGIWRFLDERVERKAGKRIDLPGAALIFITVSGLMLLVNQGASLTGNARLGVAVLTLVAGVLLVRRLLAVEDSILPLRLWRDRLILLANLSAFASGVLMIGMITYVPPYVQGVMGYAPLVAGFTLTALSLGWPIASSIAGRLLIPLGPARTAMLGGVSALIGGVLCLFFRPELGPWLVAAASFAIGAGLGFIVTASTVSVQSVVTWEQRATATAGNMLMRLLGTSLGAALFGGVLNLRLASRIEEAGEGSGLNIQAIERMMSPEALAGGAVEAGGPLGALVRQTLAGGLYDVFVGTFVAAALLFLLICLWPRSRRLE